MPNPSHNTLQATAIRLIGDHGRQVELVERETADDTWNPVVLPEVATSLIAVNTNSSDKEDASLQGKYNRKFLLDSQVIPNVAMRLRDKAQEFSIVHIKEVVPGDVSMIYKLWCMC